jgi:HEAT repeat protein/PBS lyase HEAT-like repeat-containing protein
MPTLETLAARFARCVSLFRDPSVKDEQKVEFRAFLTLVKDSAVTFRVSAGRIEVNGVPCEGKGAEGAAHTGLVQRLDFHGVAEIALSPDPPPAQLFELFQALADQPGVPDVPSRLAAAGVDRIRVTNVPAVPPTTAPRHEEAAAAEPPPAPPAEGAAAPPAPPAPTAHVGLPPAVAEALAELERNSVGHNVGDLLATLIDFGGLAAKQGRFEQLLAVIAGMLRAEARVPEASGRRRPYGIALRRMYTKPVLEALARFLAMPRHRADAVAALARGGAPAVQILLDLLVSAPTVSERRPVFDALKQMTEGTEQLVPRLDHSEWFVVRNVAELIGELGMEEAVPALARCLDHEDERVRKAVGLALAKIGTGGAAEPLRRALRDRSQEVRMQVALGIGGRKSSALAMPLVVAMEEEKDGAVVRELILALGRIGSPEAVQAIIKWAQPTGRIFGRKPSELRVAAVEALRLAASPPALGTLEGLSDDGDRDVRDAARRAVTELKRKARR